MNLYSDDRVLDNEAICVAVVRLRSIQAQIKGIERKLEHKISDSKRGKLEFLYHRLLGIRTDLYQITGPLPEKPSVGFEYLPIQGFTY